MGSGEVLSFSVPESASQNLLLSYLFIPASVQKH